MKKPVLIIAALSFVMMTSSCSLFRRGSGCPTNGKNVGAEKLMGDDPAAAKAAKKARKFKS